MRNLERAEISLFVLEEYKNARSRISADIDEINKSEIFFMTIMGAIYWFIFSVRPQNAPFLSFLLLLPVIVSIYSMSRYTEHRYVIKTHEAYVKDWIEPYFLKYEIDPCGLATYYDQRSPKYLKPIRYLFHFCLIFFSLSLAYLAFIYPDYAIELLKAKP